MIDQMPPPPVVTLDIWKELYDVAIKFKKMNPWEFLEEDQVFAVQDPVTNDIGYSIVMGAALGEFLALSVYCGKTGFYHHQRLLHGGYEGHEIDMMMDSSTLMASFEALEDLDDEDLRVIKNLGIDVEDSKRIPCFRSSPVGSPQWFLTEDEARYLSFVLHCACDVVEKVKKDSSYLDSCCKKEDLIFYAPQSGDGARCTWHVGRHLPLSAESDLVRLYSVDADEVSRISAISKREACIWEVSCMVIPGLICDKERPYCSGGVLLADRDTLAVLAFEPVPDYSEFRQQTCDVLMQTFEKTGVIPAELVFSDLLTRKVVGPLAEAFGIKSSISSVLPAVDSFKQVVTQKMGG